MIEELEATGVASGSATPGYETPTDGSVLDFTGTLAFSSANGSGYASAEDQEEPEKSCAYGLVQGHAR